MAPSAAPLAPSKAQSIWIAGRTKIFIVTAILKATITTFTKEKYMWDSGLVIAKRVIHLLTRILVGQHCPVSSFRRCQRLNSNILLSLNVSQIEKAKNREGYWLEKTVCMKFLRKKYCLKESLHLYRGIKYRDVNLLRLVLIALGFRKRWKV